MPRKARQKSILNTYHVILRSVNQQIIFEDKQDYLYFISILKHYKKSCNYKLYAYCIMDNHIHLLMEEGDVPLRDIMKHIEVKFVRWYNRKYKRFGYLFQDRFKSEPINDIRYFLTVFRYIHQNPLMAGIEPTLGTYPWSSYDAYRHLDPTFVDIEKVLQQFLDHQDCISYLLTKSEANCMEYFPTSRLSDEYVLQLIEQETACHSPSDFQRLDLQTRDVALHSLVSFGIPIRQLSRLTGISRTTIYHVMRE